MKEKSIKFTPQLGLVIVLTGVIIWLGSTYQIGAAPPEPTIEPSSTPEPPVGEHTTISIGEHMTIDIEIEASPQSPATPSAAPLLQDSESAIGRDNAISLLAVDGPWTGTTSLGYPMSFDVASGGTTWSNFKLKTNFSIGGCSGTIETTVFGPGPITNNQFSSSTGSFSFSGQFSTPTSASGTYAYVNHFIPGCGFFSQSGTWTASTSTLLQFHVYLPIIIKPPSIPPDGHWTGTTSRNQPMSFDVSDKGKTLNNFKLKTDFSVGGCSGTLEVTIGGSRPITNNQFNYSDNTFSFSGQLISLTTANGTYNFVNQLTGCGLLTQSGTWTAQLP